MADICLIENTLSNVLLILFKKVNLNTNVADIRLVYIVRVICICWKKKKSPSSELSLFMKVSHSEKDKFSK